MESVLICISTVLLLFASYTDLRWKRIPNYLTLPSILFGLLFAPLSIDKFIGIFSFFVFGYLRFMGLGDIKLCMAIIALQGVEDTLIMLAGGVIFLLLFGIMSEPRNTIQSFKQTWLMISMKDQISSGTTYPFAPFLALGYGITLFL